MATHSAKAKARPQSVIARTTKPSTAWQRTERDIQRQIEQATLGLGRWRDSDMPDWNKVPFSHYVTNVHEWDRNETWVNWARASRLPLSFIPPARPSRAACPTHGARPESGHSKRRRSRSSLSLAAS
jgi:hypothetical protein